MYHQIHLYSIRRGRYRKIYSRNIRVCEGSVWGVSTTNVEPGTIPDMPDYLDIVLCKKDGSIFYESDILRRAVNIPHDCQMGGLVLEIFIQNCDGTRYKKRHAYPKPWEDHEANGKSDMRKLKIHKTISKRHLNNQEGKDSEGCLPELRPQIDFHDFLRQLSHDIRKI